MWGIDRRSILKSSPSLGVSEYVLSVIALEQGYNRYMVAIINLLGEVQSAT
jgi:hypothetical protein